MTPFPHMVWPRFVGVLLLILIAGCDSPMSLSPLAGRFCDTGFGDSLTYGTGAAPGKDYPTVLSVLTGRKIVNAGIPGEESSQGLRRLPEVLDEHNPSLLILCHGGNDILRKRNRNQTVKNLGAMIRMARERNIEVILVGVPSYGLFLSTADFYQDVADEFNIPLEGNGSFK